MNCFRGLRTPLSFNGFGKLVSWANPLLKHGERDGWNKERRSVGVARQSKALADLDMVNDDLGAIWKQRTAGKK